jgi:predicted RNase H-like nuclease (RuvC/YqgF family)
MRTRTKLFASALVASAALAGAIPAQAQNYPQHGYQQGYQDRNDHNDRRDWNDRNDRNGYNNGNANAIRSQIEQLQYRISRNDGRDRISDREAAGLRRAVYELQQQFRSYNRDGLNQREARYLQDRINQVRSRLQHERQDNNGRRW